MIDFEYRLNKLEAKLNNIVRIGKVSSINEQNCTAKVVFEEFDNNFVSYDLPVMVKQSLVNKDYWLPDINEQVVCVFLPTGLESGFILGSLYNEEDKPNLELSAAHKRSITFSDGSCIEYDRNKHELNVNISNNGKMIVNAKEINIKAENANLSAKKANVEADEILAKSQKLEATADKAIITADTTINGDLNINGNVKAAGNISGVNVSASGTLADSTGSVAKMRSSYNSHAHSNQGASPPSTPM